MAAGNQDNNRDMNTRGTASDLQATEEELGIGTTAAGGDNAGNPAPPATGGSGQSAAGAGQGADLGDGTSGL